MLGLVHFLFGWSIRTHKKPSRHGARGRAAGGTAGEAAGFAAGAGKPAAQGQRTTETRPSWTFPCWRRRPDDLIDRTWRWVQADARASRAVGSLLGLAAADWVGSPLEFLEVTDEPGESRWDHDSFSCLNPNRFEIERGLMQPGQWTDDTSMALCLADSLLLCEGLNGSDLRLRFWCWYGEGMNNPFRLDKERKKRKSFGLGYNTAKSLMALKPDLPIEPEYINPGSSDSGNGGLMRLAPVAIFYNLPERVEETLDAAAKSSLATHPGALATETARFLAFLLHAAINRAEDASARDFLVQSSGAYVVRLDHRLKATEDEEVRAALLELRALASSSKEGDLERCWNWQQPSLELLATFR
ncbi:unnamed protein product, partial [Effrenium voratum]